MIRSGKLYNSVVIINLDSISKNGLKMAYLKLIYNRYFIMYN